MLVLSGFPVAKTKKDATGSVKTKKSHTHADRKDDFTNVQAYRDVAEWLVDLGVELTRKLKKTGVIQGRQKISVARIIDPHLREIVWTALWKIRHEKRGTPNEPIPDVPSPPVEPIDLGVI